MENEKKITFEEGLKRLNEIATKMNENVLPLADAMSLYKEAKNLIAILNSQIDEAEKLIEDKVE
ncbi:exodeoxyribonuclease VII small subunit [bacterium]|nr:exodeoxyribonuclease VII small subunit [bacterium]MDY2687565.1 exodeoxyribonuclease VII small subunit [Candidatus Enteromonas sp.]